MALEAQPFKSILKLTISRAFRVLSIVLTGSQALIKKINLLICCFPE